LAGEGGKEDLDSYSQRKGKKAPPFRGEKEGRRLPANCRKGEKHHHTTLKLQKKKKGKKRETEFQRKKKGKGEGCF